MLNEWNGFNDGVWTKEINVRNFIQKNYTLYEGDDSFLADVSQKTKKVWNKCEELLAEELKNGGVLDVETDIISGITNFAPGYIDKENEVIVGLQTDAPLKRIVNLYGGKRMAHQSLEQYGYKLNEEIDRHFNEYRKTHNEGVFDAYPKRTRLARTAGLLTGLPDAYGHHIGGHGSDQHIHALSFFTCIHDIRLDPEIILGNALVACSDFTSFIDNSDGLSFIRDFSDHIPKQSCFSTAGW